LAAAPARSHLLEKHPMTRLALRLCPLAVALALGVAGTRPAAAGDKEDFTPLFNGKDMSGFKYILGGKKGDDPLKTKTWRVEDGVIICTGSPGGYFYTDKSYKNYIVLYDWKYKRPAGLEDDKKFNGNSGLLVHIQEPHKVWPKSLEVQGMNRDHGSFISIGGVKISDYKFNRKNLEKARNKVGEWNTTEVTVRDGEVTCKVNGVPVASGKVNLTEGPFGLQSEGAEIHFKNIKIKILK
jgi:hypothetical protein